MTTPPRRVARRLQGFVLIEVLIAMLIFSIGTLGLVGLQASLARAATSAKMRADAAYLAQDIIGTMWADAANLGSYAACASYAPCSAWHTKVANTLPSANTSLSICTSSGACTNDSMGYKPEGQVRITIVWTVPGEATHSYDGLTGSHRYETSTSINP